MVLHALELGLDMCRKPAWQHPEVMPSHSCLNFGLASQADGFWVVLQPVCTTEIGRLALKYKELQDKDVKLATLSCDSVRNLLSQTSLAGLVASLGGCAPIVYIRPHLGHPKLNSNARNTHA